MEDLDPVTLRLMNVPNLLSRRIMGQRDMSKIYRAPGRGEMSVRDIVAHMRDVEAQYFPKMHLISINQVPDLRRVEGVPPQEYDPNDSIYIVVSQFRRVRQSTLSLLRGLPPDGWNRVGIDSDNSTVSIRQLAEELAGRDAESLALLDATLEARDATPYLLRREAEATT